MPARRPDDSANQLPGPDPGFAARDRSGGTPLSPNSSPCKRSTPLGSTACRKQPAARQPPKHCKRSSISISTNSASSSRHAALAETEPVSCQRLGGQPHPPALTLDPQTRPVTSPQRPAGRPHPGRLQIGMVAAFKSERVAAFKSEYPAGFIGIRTTMYDVIQLSAFFITKVPPCPGPLPPDYSPFPLPEWKPEP